MIHKTVVVGPLACNCVILGCETTKEGIIIDPGDEPQKILDLVGESDLKIKHILHTHAHFDHFGATGAVKEKTQGQICLHQSDEVLYNQLPMQGQMFGFKFDPAPKVDHFIQDEEILTFGDYSLQTIHTPGHSPGSICFKLLQGDEHIFSGDTLFNRSVGRSDLWGGDGRQLVQSIKDRLFRFDDETQVFPGHGPQTQIGVEKRENPFL